MLPAVIKRDKKVMRMKRDEVLILSVDTSSPLLSASLFKRNKGSSFGSPPGSYPASCPPYGEVASVFKEIKKGESRDLDSFVRKLLRKNRVKIEDVGLIVCGVGPGAFAGVRTAVAYVNGISAALKIPLVGVSSLWSIAARLSNFDGPKYVIVPARAGYLYCAVIEWKRAMIACGFGDEKRFPPMIGPGGRVICQISSWGRYRLRDCMKSKEKVLEEIEGRFRGALLLGWGLKAYPEMMTRSFSGLRASVRGEERLGEGQGGTDLKESELFMYPDSRGLVDRGLAEFERGRFSYRLKPLYLTSPLG